MYKVQFKSHNALQAWMGYGTYGSEGAAIQSATRIAGKYFMVRVIDAGGHIVWIS
jgi:hypothetical protein